MKELFSQIDGLYQQADLPAVEEKLTGALKKLEKQGKERSPEYAQVANELAGFYRGVSRYPESLHFFQTAMELLAEHGLLESEGICLGRNELRRHLSSDGAVGPGGGRVPQREGAYGTAEFAGRLCLSQYSEQPFPGLPDAGEIRAGGAAGGTVPCLEPQTGAGCP